MPQGLKCLLSLFHIGVTRVYIAVISSAPSRHRTHYHVLLDEDVWIPPLHRFNMVVADHRGSGAGASLKTQLCISSLFRRNVEGSGQIRAFTLALARV